MMTATPSPIATTTTTTTTTTAQQEQQPTAATAPAAVCSILEHPAGAAPGGVWYLQSCEDVERRSGSISSYYYEDSPGKTVELFHDGVITPLKPHQRVLYCLRGTFGAAAEWYDVHGTRIEETVFLSEEQEEEQHATHSLERRPHSSTIQPLAQGYRVVRPAARHRPVGTLKGGTWYQQTLAHEETSFGRSKKRLLYREAEDRYYTESGLQVHPHASSLICLGKDEEDDDDNNFSSSLTRSKNEFAGTSATSIASLSNLVQGPVGSPPGGKWFKQTLVNNNNNNDLGSLVFGRCLGSMGLVPLFVPPEWHETERYVYQEPVIASSAKKQPRYVDVEGRFADPKRGPLTPLPDGFDPIHGR